MNTGTALQIPAVAATVTALLGLLAAFLTFRVIRQRVVFDVHAGDGGKPPLAQAMRAHTNFAEHAPLALLLLALAEVSGAHRGWIVALGGLLLLARLVSAWGLSHSLGPSTARQAGAGMTVLATAATATLLLVRLWAPA